MNKKELAIWAFAQAIVESANAGSLEDCRILAEAIQDVLTDSVIEDKKKTTVSRLTDGDPELQ